jgi:hypothetical protein
MRSSTRVLPTGFRLTRASRAAVTRRTPFGLLAQSGGERWDHLWGHTGGDNIWVWKSFMRGLNVLLMEELLPSPTWQDSARQAMGQVRRLPIALISPR